MDSLSGEYPSDEPNIPEITGPFTVSVTARFDVVSGKYWQRMFDFGDGPDSNNIVLSQKSNTDGVRFSYYPNDGGATFKYELVIPSALTTGTKDLWHAGIAATSRMTAPKNGALLGSLQAAVPQTGVIRLNKLLGESNWAGDSRLDGAILGLQVPNLGSSETLLQRMELLNLPSQIRHSFVASVYARFDNLAGGFYQRVFDFGNGQETDVVALSQQSITNNIYLEVWQSSEIYQCIATNAIVQNETALWRVEITSDGTYNIENNGVLI